MAEFDHGTKRIVEAAGQQLARIAHVDCATWEPLESTLPITVELLADRAFVASNPDERFVVYFEFFTTWDTGAFWDILAKSSLLSRREKLPTVCVVVVLQPEGAPAKKKGRIQHEVAGKVVQFVALEVVYLWEEHPEPWWEAEPGLMALYPLCHHGEEPETAIRHAAEVIERTASDLLERRDFLTFLGIYAKMKYPLVNAIDIIGREKMRESAFAQEWVEEGSLMTRRTDIHEILADRFGADAAEPFVAALKSIANWEALNRLFRMAYRCATLEEFEAALPPPSSTP
jgi:hypothetical protein